MRSTNQHTTQLQIRKYTEQLDSTVHERWELAALLEFEMSSKAGAHSPLRTRKT